ncbi:unnamed protein product [Pieris macdunnoughi]|uniref:Ig-like domain-containing protein n=1 Tax=Pieris macdunnoughi TaxID=345717 RepID=A0A821T3Z2_9NEOP|nr:unnamed protein product [Pieris macdunnoughi]
MYKVCIALVRLSLKYDNRFILCKIIDEEEVIEVATTTPIIIVTEVPLVGIPTVNTSSNLIQYLTHPPEITIRPRNLQVRANGIAAFYCAARGDPKPNIQWRKNGKRVSSMQSRYQVSGMDKAAGPAANGAVLRIEPVRAQRDDATYECVAENGVGDAVTALATLTVFEILKSRVDKKNWQATAVKHQLFKVGFSMFL